MPKYTVLEKSFINNMLYEEGAIVEYDGDVGDNLQLIPEKKTKPPVNANTDPSASNDLI